ncbi:MAG: twin-arginine translocation signal domain-containing protein [Proteobacteria bacterium]|nr:twin-arginine translocation signal domain-containing protein [Pseudomonadota bacterium]
MNRREFLKHLGTAALLLTPASVLAQVPSREAIEKAKAHLAQSLEQTLKLESVNPDDVEWISGYSNGDSCTFSE